jgi:hypothetical protein
MPENLKNKGSRIQGFKGSSEKLKNYKELKIWQKRLRIQGLGIKG